MTADISNAPHMTINGIIHIIRLLLQKKMSYVLTCEFEFGIWCQLSGGNYHISMQQVLTSLSFRRLKLFIEKQCKPSSTRKWRLLQRRLIWRSLGIYWIMLSKNIHVNRYRKVDFILHFWICRKEEQHCPRWYTYRKGESRVWISESCFQGKIAPPTRRFIWSFDIFVL